MNDFSKELSFKTSRSGGAGGQNVNKVETAVTAMWKVSETKFFSDEQIELILERKYVLWVKRSASSAAWGRWPRRICSARSPA